MKVRRGDVVILEHPFSDARGTKVRPALVVQSDPRNSALTNTIVAMITRTVTRVGLDPSQLLIDITTPDGQVSGLVATSAVTCGNLFTVHEDRIRKRIGYLPPALLGRIDACLKVTLGIP